MHQDTNIEATRQARAVPTRKARFILPYFGKVLRQNHKRRPIIKPANRLCFCFLFSLLALPLAPCLRSWTVHPHQKRIRMGRNRFALIGEPKTINYASIPKHYTRSHGAPRLSVVVYRGVWALEKRYRFALRPPFPSVLLPSTSTVRTDYV